MGKGNPNPSPATRFKSGAEWTGSPGGKTSEHRKNEIAAAELSARLRFDQLMALVGKTGADREKLVESITSTNLQLVKQSEDRAYGTPKQTNVLAGDEENPVHVVTTMSDLEYARRLAFSLAKGHQELKENG
jgi:hypothetical protein